MTHYTALVCLPAGTAIADVCAAVGEVLAPWDENRDVEPYRSYETGTPGQFWAVPDLRHKGWALAEPGLTWSRVADAYNAEYDPADTDRLKVDQDGRAYTMSTYNPESTWDWWVIGGRWQRQLVAVPHATAAELVFGEPGAGGDNGAPHRTTGLHCDGGPRRLLDFAAMRKAAETAAHKRYDQWEAICADTPPARSWPQFTSLVSAGELDIAHARDQYHAQPRIVAAERAGLTGWLSCPVEEFGAGRDGYVAEARQAAVPGYALVTLDGRWVAPGRMGWFGTSSDGPGERAHYYAEANAYLDALDPHALVVLVDCHI